MIQKINNLYFEEEPYLYSLDIVSLYTNINQSHAIDTITEFMSRYLDNFHIDIIGFHMLLKIMFNSNVFFFDENFFKQICSLFIFTQKHQVFSINLFLVASKVNEWVQPSLGPVLKECPITP